MMKLVIGFDVMGIDPIVMDSEAAFDKIIDFLENQFPEWDYQEAFDIDNTDFDWINHEAHIPMNIID